MKSVTVGNITIEATDNAENKFRVTNIDEYTLVVDLYDLESLGKAIQKIQEEEVKKPIQLPSERIKSSINKGIHYEDKVDRGLNQIIVILDEHHHRLERLEKGGEAK